MNHKKQDGHHSINAPVFRLRGRIEQSENPQYKIIISKKNLPRAVDRNCVRRRTQEILRKNEKTKKHTLTLYYQEKTVLSSQDLTQHITNIFKNYGHPFSHPLL